MKPPARTPNTLYSLEATEYAQQHGKFLEFHHAAYKAFWEDRKDIGQIEVLGVHSQRRWPGRAGYD